MPTLYLNDYQQNTLLRSPAFVRFRYTGCPQSHAQNGCFSHFALPDGIRDADRLWRYDGRSIADSLKAEMVSIDIMVRTHSSAPAANSSPRQTIRR